MAPLASVFVAVRPNMITFAGEAAAGISAARLGQAGAAQGAAFGKSFGASASKLMVAGFAVGLGALLKDSVKAAGDFQTQMVRLVTSAGETGNLVSGNLKIVSDGILDMASKVGTSVSDLGKAMYTVESGSFHGADALKVLQAAAEGAKAEGADLTRVTNAVTTALVDYHLDASKSADITSKLVAATAAGKTTFEGLTGSLHSILPIAAAAGVSIDDILGSLASMTLHGISAEEATQNMADAIRHLQNPTDVMKGELALLGIDSRHLSEDLGEKGLSGTLKMIADRIKQAMPPGSQEVYLQMSTALKGLNPQVQKLGLELIKGTITAKDYRTESLALDPINRAQAQQFATLAAATHRIGGEQISGAQVMQSYAGALAKATGDSASLNVALQLTGENSDNTARAIGMVSSATAEAGGHVKGWSEITGTFNFKLAAMKAEFEKLTIQIGTVLLPKVGELVGKVTELLGPMSEWVKNHAELTEKIAGTVGALVGLSGGVIVISKLVGAFKGMLEVLRITAAAQWLLNAAVGTNVAITSAAELQIAAYLVWSRLAAVSTRVWAAVQWALNAAFIASPWGLIVVAIAAVVGGIVWAFFHFKGFHNFILAAWAWIKSAGIATWHALVIAFHWVGDAAVWLWQHALKPAWDGIVIASRFVWEGIKFYFGLIKLWFGIVADVAVWLYKNVFHPTFTAISFLVKAFWTVVQIYFALIKIYFENVVWPVVKFLWNGVFKPAFESIGTAVMWLWHHAIKPFAEGVAVDFRLLWSILKPIWNALVSVMVDYVGPAFVWLWHHVIEPFWHGIQSAAELVWNKGIKPIFHELADFVTKTIPDAFGHGVDFVGKAWDRLKQVVTAPISWVIDTVINHGLIDTINSVAKMVGVKPLDHVANPFSNSGSAGSTGGGGGGRAPQFRADGGLLSGPGGPRDDLIPIMASNGEYIIPAHVVRDLGVSYFDALIGRRKPQYPGDGSSGIAVGHYADGGLVEALTSPAKWLGGKVDGLIGQIPGAGAFKNLAVGTARKLVGGLVKWVENKLGFGDAGGNVGAAQAFIRSQAGKPYIWASAGPDGYDCSGIVSAVWNLLHGRSPYSHTFSTSNEAGFFPHPGMGVFTAGWANPGERGGGRVGHTAGWLAGLPFESTGSQGVHIGSGVTPVDSFAHIGHMAAGGLVKVPRFDRGGTLRRGLNVVNNATGRDEHLRNADLPVRLDDYTIARLAQALSARPVKVEISGPDLGLTVAGVAP